MRVPPCWWPAPRSSITIRSTSRSFPAPAVAPSSAAASQTYHDDTVVALSFSGGGTRAAAFSYGVLTGFDETPTPEPLGLAARSHRFRHRRIRRLGACRLLRAEEAQGAGRFQAAFSSAQRRGRSADEFQPVQHRQGAAGRHQRPERCSRAGSTTICSSTRPSRALLYQRRPYIWINASDIYNRTPFVFGRVLFGALVQRSCQLSDFDGGGCIRGRAGGLRAGGHSGLSRRLRGAIARLGAPRAAGPECSAAAAGNLPTPCTAITPARSAT